MSDPQGTKDTITCADSTCRTRISIRSSAATGSALKAEAFARFFGTPTFLIAQTVIVAIWIWLNAIGWTQFDVYPFILLNLAFSTQAAYAAPLILLAQTRQADRDKANSIADAQHREEICIRSTRSVRRRCRSRRGS